MATRENTRGFVVSNYNGYKPSIHIKLKQLIDEKSKRDQTNFTACQLAAAINIPRSILTKLTHSDLNKRVVNPRVETLIKIVDFFKKDGFDISIEDLVGSKTKKIDVYEQTVEELHESKQIPIYLFDNLSEKIGTTNITVRKNNHSLKGLLLSNDMKPFFRKGSLFIIDELQNIEEGNLVAISSQNKKEILVRRYTKKKNKVLLQSLDDQESDITMIPTERYEIIGVIIQVNAKT